MKKINDLYTKGTDTLGLKKINISHLLSNVFFQQRNIIGWEKLSSNINKMAALKKNLKIQSW